MIYYEIMPKDALKIPSILCVGHSDVDCAYGPAIRDQYIVHYVLTGRGFFDGRPVEAGQGFIITPGVEHAYTYDKDDQWSYLWFKSRDPEILSFFEMHNPVDGIFTYHNKDEIIAIVNRISSERRKFMSATQLGEIFMHIFNECVAKKHNENSTSSKSYCDYCKRYIDLNMDKPVTVNVLCEVLGITQPYLYKIFKTELGVSPKRYIVRAKIRRAKNMLSNTDAPISVIAASLGFSDTISFSKFFKSAVGASPSAFRDKR